MLRSWYRRLGRRHVVRRCFVVPLLAGALLGGCASVAAANLPKWVQSPPQDTLIAIYGVGEGRSFAEARQQALRAIAGKLSTRVSSAAVAKGSSSGGATRRHYQETVQAYVEDIKLSSYDVRQTEFVHGRYFALVEMSRENFVKDTQLRLDTAESDLQRALSASRGAGRLDRFIACQAAPPLIEQARLLSLVLSSTDDFFDAAPRFARYSEYADSCAKALQGVTLSLSYGSTFKPIADAVSQRLPVKTIGRGSADGQIRIDGDIQRGEIFKNKSVVIALAVEFLDAAGAVVASQTYRLNGNSVTSHEQALQNAVTGFLNADGAERVLVDLKLK